MPEPSKIDGFESIERISPCFSRDIYRIKAWSMPACSRVGSAQLDIEKVQFPDKESLSHKDREA
jgi:hypothetical protein